MRSKGRGWNELQEFSKQMYKERYFDRGEDYDKWISRVSGAYSDNKAHAERIATYIRKYWFHPSTPVSSNADRPSKGLPISCYTNQVEDSKGGIFSTWEENNWLGSFGGGIGTSWSAVRGLGEKIGKAGKSSGIIPFIKVSDSTTLAVSQGGLRRASQAVYIDVSHPEVLEFIDIRRPTGDSERRSPNIHHGIAITDAFMSAVIKRESWELVSPKTGKVTDVVDAFDLYKKILVSRMETGEPYLFFKDNTNNQNPIEYRLHDREVTTSNLCSEIMIHTDSKRSGVCCLTSMNLEYFNEWEQDELFLEDIHRYTDNILTSFLIDVQDKPGFERVTRSTIEERNIGIGVMGYHSYLQSIEQPYGSLVARYLTDRMFKHIKQSLDASNLLLGRQKGTAKISKNKRNVHVTAVAPTASISTLCNLTSPGIDPRVSNIYVAKTNVGSYTVKNKFLIDTLETYGKNTEEVWKDITKHQGSVQHLEWMSQGNKDVYKTAYEINQHAIIDMVKIMTPNITQGISTNLFFPADVDVKKLYDVHIKAWTVGLKSLYYCRSTSINRAAVGHQERIKLEEDTCASCA